MRLALLFWGWMTVPDLFPEWAGALDFNRPGSIAGRLGKRDFGEGRGKATLGVTTNDDDEDDSEAELTHNRERDAERKRVIERLLEQRRLDEGIDERTQQRQATRLDEEEERLVDAIALGFRQEVPSPYQLRQRIERPLYLYDPQENLYLSLPRVELGLWYELANTFDRVRLVFQRAVTNAGDRTLIDRRIVARIAGVAKGCSQFQEEGTHSFLSELTRALARALVEIYPIRRAFLRARMRAYLERDEDFMYGLPMRVDWGNFLRREALTLRKQPTPEPQWGNYGSGGQRSHGGTAVPSVCWRNAWRSSQSICIRALPHFIQPLRLRHHDHTLSVDLN